jgi:fibronectin type 3 domain-containing protein
MVDNPQDEPLQFAVYRFALYEPIILSSVSLVGITRGNSFVDKIADGKKYTYVVTALDRLHNESTMSNNVE